MTLETARFIVEILVLAVGVGYWAGEVRARKHRRPALEDVNGQPGLGELRRMCRGFERELDRVQRSALPRSEGDRRFNELWGAVKDLRNANAHLQRRIDSVIGQG